MILSLFLIAGVALVFAFLIMQRRARSGPYASGHGDSSWVFGDVGSGGSDGCDSGGAADSGGGCGDGGGGGGGGD